MTLTSLCSPALSCPAPRPEVPAADLGARQQRREGKGRGRWVAGRRKEQGVLRGRLASCWWLPRSGARSGHSTLGPDTRAFGIKEPPWAR